MNPAQIQYLGKTSALYEQTHLGWVTIHLLKQLHLVNRAHIGKIRVKQEADYIFHEPTQSIIPEYKTLMDSKNLIEDNMVLMRKRFPPTPSSQPSSDPTHQNMWTSLIGKLDKIRKTAISEELDYCLSVVVELA